MKKNYMIRIIGFLLILTFTFPIMAEPTCVGGTPITANDYTDPNAPSDCTEARCPHPPKTFCKSDKVMNWWSAFNWCKSNNREFAKIQTLCPGTQVGQGKACPAMQGVGSVSVWASTMMNANYAFMVSTSSGGMFGNGWGRNSAIAYAICE